MKVSQECYCHMCRICSISMNKRSKSRIASLLLFLRCIICGFLIINLHQMYYFVITSWHTSPHLSRRTAGTAGVPLPPFCMLNVITNPTLKCAIYINFREGAARVFHMCRHRPCPLLQPSGDNRLYFHGR